MAARPSIAGLGALRDRLDRLQALGRSRRAAAFASVIWAVLVGAYAIGFFGASEARGTVFIDGAFFLVTLALPLLLIWLAAFLAEELDRQRQMIAALAELVAPLADRLDAVRDGLERHGPASPSEIARAVQGAVLAARAPDARPDARPSDAALERVLAGQAQIAARFDALLAAASAPPEAAPPAPAAPRRTAPRDPGPAPEAAGEPELPLPGAQPEAPLDWDDLIRAFDFPRDAEDDEGFRALRRALRRRAYAQMLQTAEDVMTLLSQEGVYMDDLAVEPADPAIWRRFIAGARGEAAAGMGGVRDPGAIATARALMKSDTIFRDAALFFQRRFDAVLTELAGQIDDAELARLADTRSGRAFQLMARASGSFD